MNLIQVYKSTHKDEMYLYVDKKEDLSRVPEPLLKQFGTPKKVMLIPLTPEKKLARAQAQDVLDQVKEQGFYLQMPPAKSEQVDDYVQKLAEYAAKFDQDEER